MIEALQLPKAAEAIPESIRKFAAQTAPLPARMMAAKGLLPIKGNDLVCVLLELAHHPEHEVSSTAKGTLLGLPLELAKAACTSLTDTAYLHALVLLQKDKNPKEWWVFLATNRSVHDLSMEVMASSGPDEVCEHIALDQERMLRHPMIIECLYKNKFARMSTVDRLVEFAARNKLELHGIATFEAHVQAISGQLIPEPSDEPLPADQFFQQAIEEDKPEADVVDQDDEGEEKVKESFKPLSLLIGDMSFPEKLRMCMMGNAAARALLARDSNKIVSLAAVSSPMVTEQEAISFAHSKQVSPDVLKYIGNKKEWMGSYELKKALCFNAKAPLGLVMKYLVHLRKSDLTDLSRSRGIPASVKNFARQRLETMK